MRRATGEAFLVVFLGETRAAARGASRPRIDHWRSRASMPSWTRGSWLAWPPSLASSLLSVPTRVSLEVVRRLRRRDTMSPLEARFPWPSVPLSLDRLYVGRLWRVGRE